MFRQQWQSFVQSEPGKRFQERNRRHSGQRRYGVLAGGIALMLIGLFFLIAPGPGIPFLLLGAALIAEESFVAARFLDWLELWLRKTFSSKAPGSRTR